MRCFVYSDKLIKFIPFFLLLLVILMPTLVFGQTEVGEITSKVSSTLSGDTGYNPIKGFVNWLITSVFLTFGTTVLVTAGEIFNYLLWFTLDTSLLKQPFVENAWATFRDMANLSFILVLIYVSFTLITGQKADVGKALFVKLILIGLVLNFSLLISQVIIDAGNIAGLAFYNSITVESGSTSKVIGAEGDVKDVSGTIIKFANPAVLIGTDVFTKLKDKDQTPSWNKIFVVSLFYFIMCLMLGISLLKAGFFFISRTAWLLLLMLLSPLAFVSLFTPLWSQYFKQWFEAIFQRSFCVCLYMFFLFILITVGEFASKLINTKNNPGDDWTVWLITVATSFSIVYVILQMAEASTKEACEGKQAGLGSMLYNATAGKAVGFAAGAAVGVATGAPGLLARATLGQVGRTMQQGGYGIKGMALSDNVVAKTIGLTALGIGDKMYNAKYGLDRSNKEALNAAHEKRQAEGQKLGVLAKDGFSDKFIVQQQADKQKEIDKLNISGKEKMVARGIGGQGAKDRLEIDKQNAETIAKEIQGMPDNEQVKKAAGEYAAQQAVELEKDYHKTNAASAGGIIDYFRSGFVAGASGEALNTVSKKESTEKRGRSQRQKSLDTRAAFAEQAATIKQSVNGAMEMFANNLSDPDFGVNLNKKAMDKFITPLINTMSRITFDSNGSPTTIQPPENSREMLTAIRTRNTMNQQLSDLDSDSRTKLKALEDSLAANSITEGEFSKQKNTLDKSTKGAARKMISNAVGVGLSQLDARVRADIELAGSDREAALDELQAAQTLFNTTLAEDESTFINEQLQTGGRT